MWGLCNRPVAKASLRKRSTVARLSEWLSCKVLMAILLLMRVWTAHISSESFYIYTKITRRSPEPPRHKAAEAYINEALRGLAILGVQLITPTQEIREALL
jgi:hypothetical protein